MFVFEAHTICISFTDLDFQVTNSRIKLIRSLMRCGAGGIRKNSLFLTIKRQQSKWTVVSGNLCVNMVLLLKVSIVLILIRCVRMQISNGLTKKTINKIRNTLKIPVLSFFFRWNKIVQFQVVPSFVSVMMWTMACVRWSKISLVLGHFSRLSIWLQVHWPHLRTFCKYKRFYSTWLNHLDKIHSILPIMKQCQSPLTWLHSIREYKSFRRQFFTIERRIFYFNSPIFIKSLLYNLPQSVIWSSNFEQQSLVEVNLGKKSRNS